MLNKNSLAYSQLLHNVALPFTFAHILEHSDECNVNETNSNIQNSKL